MDRVLERKKMPMILNVKPSRRFNLTDEATKSTTIRWVH